MDKEIIREAFEKEMERLRYFAAKAAKEAGINAYLKQFSWVFVHPYLQGFNIEQLEQIMKTQSGSNEIIHDLFVAHFYDLNRTAYYVDGYYKERPSLKPFCLLIDQSIILCLQRDFAGAINVLIPVIEGSIRHFLTTYDGKEQHEIMKKEKLLKVFTSMQQRVRASHRYYYEHFPALYKENMRFHENQVKLLTNQAMAFYDSWFSIIIDYFSNNLYLSTDGNPVLDNLNRHVIFHGFDTKIYYSLENYLRLFHCLHFLSWAFGVALPGIPALPVLEESDILDKWKAFEKIKLTADLTWKSKEAIYNVRTG